MPLSSLVCRNQGPNTLLQPGILGLPTAREVDRERQADWTRADDQHSGLHSVIHAFDSEANRA
jgi:hypothetical protein